MLLTRAEFLLEATKGETINYNMGSLLQGALMERLTPDYAELLHHLELNPYSQYLSCRASEIKWVVSTLTETAEQAIIAKLLDTNWKEIVLTRKNIKLCIKERTTGKMTSEALLEKTFFAQCPRCAVIYFLTPAAFKTGGKYQNYPTVPHIFQSLINRYNAVNGDSELPVESTLELVRENVLAVGYNLRSTTFGVEGIRIPSFLGSLTLKFNGPQQLVNLLHMLLRFGTYSGVGIKTAMGMGAIQVIEKAR